MGCIRFVGRLQAVRLHRWRLSGTLANSGLGFVVLCSGDAMRITEPPRTERRGGAAAGEDETIKCKKKITVYVMQRADLSEFTVSMRFRQSHGQTDGLTPT
jgi:hypothetical protein